MPALARSPIHAPDHGNSMDCVMQLEDMGAPTFAPAHIEREFNQLARQWAPLWPVRSQAATTQAPEKTSPSGGTRLVVPRDVQRAAGQVITARAALGAALAALVACTGSITPDVAGDDDDDSTVRIDSGAGGPGVIDAAPGGSVDGAPAPPPDATPDYAALSAEEQALFDTINQERVAAGKVAVELRTDLNCAARRHSDDIGTIGACTHTGSDGSSPGDRVAGCSGPGWSGEIVACGQGTPRAAVDAWIGSPGHNAIMFDGGQRFIGVAMHNNYWTAIFDR